MKKEKLLLFDANSIIHRAFHALPPLKDKKGEPSGAVYGSLLVFFKMISEINPRYLAVAFDSPGKTFRHEKYKEYKANRPKAPDELVSQIKKTKEVFEKMGAATLAKEGLEADDIVGAVSSCAPEGVETVIVTGDADILQLVNGKTKVYTLKRGVKESVLYDRKKVEEKYGGVPPERVVDIKALQGDPSDNIPGVEGVGEKTAIKLVKKFGRLEDLYSSLKKESPEEVSKKVYEKLKKQKKEAFLSRDLATIDRKCLSGIDFGRFSFQQDKEKTGKVLQDLGFLSMANRFLGEKKENKKPSKEGRNLKLNFN